jgi:hypothetical protein
MERLDRTMKPAGTKRAIRDPSASLPLATVATRLALLAADLPSAPRLGHVRLLLLLASQR